MYNAWTTIGTIGGAGALSYLAAGQTVNGAHTLRLSIDKSGSLLGDVRLWGGGLALLSSIWVKNKNAKDILRLTSVAAFSSLVTTELVRWRLARTGGGVARQLPLAPALSFGALGGGSPAHQSAPAGAWASR